MGAAPSVSMEAARLWLFLSLAISGSVEAEDEPLVEEREFVEPVSIDEVLPNQPGEAAGRLSLGARLAAADGEEPQLVLLPNLQVFFGLTKRVGAEVGVGLQVSARSGTVSLSLASAGVKFLLVKPEEMLPGVVLKLEAIPWGEEGPQACGSLGLIQSVWRLTAQGSMGISTRFSYGPPVVALALSVSLRATDRLFFLAEAQGEGELGSRSTALAYAGPALKWIASPSSFVALGAVFGLSGGSDPFRAVVQLQHRL